MAVIDNKNTILYLAHERLAEWAGIVVESSVRKSRKYQNKAEKLRYFLKAMEYDFYLEDEDITSLLQCINNLAELTDWPVVPVIGETQAPVAITGVPGPIGASGINGTDGTDANIVVESGDDIIEVAETLPGGIKTYTITYEPYTLPLISLTVEDSSFPNPNSLVQELGETISSVQITTILDKGKDVVDSSVLLSPGGGSLASDYLTALDLSNLNLGNQEVIVVNDSNVAATQLYQAEIDDSTNQPVSSKTISFVVPFLYGSSTTLLVKSTFYANLTRIIELQGDKTVPFNAEDSYFYFLYPNTYPDLDKILDGNGFNAINAFTKFADVSVTMSSGDVDMTIYRTTLITDISLQEYTFKF